ncbi:patatin-like phospholipase family protein [bacterium]|nr:patatin-like phospholipase family protein [bacterium]
MTKRELEYACLFGGGAIRGLAHIGVVKALDELGIKIGTLAGSSVGAIIAAALAVGYSYEEIEKFFLDINFELFKDIDFSKTVALSKGNVFLDRIRDVIELKFYGDKYEKGKNPPVTFKDLKKNLVIITTDLNSFKCKEFSPKATPDFEVAHAVRISACMPGLMKPIKMDDKILVDGDLQKSHPMWELCSGLKNLNENILEIRLEGSPGSDLKNPLSFINTVYSCVTSLASDYVAAKNKFDENHDCLVIDTGDVLILDMQIKKEARKRLIKSGYEQTINYFKNLLPVKKREILDNYIKIRNKISDIKEYVLKDKTSEAQAVYSKLLLQFVQNSSLVNDAIKSEIAALSDEIFDNTAKTLIFKRKFFKNYKELCNKLDKISGETDKKITMLLGYPWINSVS